MRDHSKYGPFPLLSGSTTTAAQRAAFTAEREADKLVDHVLANFRAEGAMVHCIATARAAAAAKGEQTAAAFQREIDALFPDA